MIFEVLSASSMRYTCIRACTTNWPSAHKEEDAHTGKGGLNSTTSFMNNILTPDIHFKLKVLVLNHFISLDNFSPIFIYLTSPLHIQLYWLCVIAKVRFTTSSFHFRRTKTYFTLIQFSAPFVLSRSVLAIAVCC